VEHGKTYLLRVINAGFVSGFDFGIASHHVELVAADSTYTKRRTFESVAWSALNVGQRLNLLIKADQNRGHYGIGVRSSMGPHAFGLSASVGHASARLSYVGAPPTAGFVPANIDHPPYALFPPNALPPDVDKLLWNEWTQIRADTTAKQWRPVPAHATQVIELDLTTDFGWQGGLPQYYFNGVVFHMPQGKPWFQGNHDAHHIDIKYGEVVDVVIKNIIFPHPYHLHGYAPWQIAVGFGYFLLFFVCWFCVLFVDVLFFCV
jgi:FtsP/CotA-like multicopper oxidase with cupredoxin domain